MKSILPYTSPRVVSRAYRIFSKTRTFAVMKSRHAAVAVICFASLGASYAYAADLTLSSFGLDVVLTSIGSFFLLAAAGVGSLMVSGLSLEVGVATIMKYVRKTMGGGR